MNHRLFLCLLLSPFALSASPAERHLFLDDSLVSNLSGVERRLHPPVRTGKVFAFDAPWEGVESGYAAVMPDGEGGYRLYYRGGGETTREVACLAVSTDGVAWKRQPVGLFEYKGSRENNIVLMPERPSYAEAHNFFPFLDSAPGVPPGERWKAVGLGWHLDEAGERHRALSALVSPDGIQWKSVAPHPVIWKGGGFDSQNVTIRDPLRDRYLCFSRVGLAGLRHIQVCESSDFRTWTEPRPIEFTPPADTQFYTNAITTAPTLRDDDGAPWYVGMPMRFVPGRKTVQGRATDGVSDAVLISSRDTLHWDWSPREAWIRPGPDPDNWGNAHGNSTPLCGILATGELEWSVYWIDDYGTGVPKIERGTLRPEGFQSLHAGARTGTVRIGPFSLEGKSLLLNAGTSATGTVRVAVVDSQGKAVPSHGLGDCQPIWGDGLVLPVEWTGGRHAITTGGTASAFLEVELTDADLYALRIVASVKAP